MVTALSTKLARDLLRMTGQAVTIAVVVACGIASYVCLQTAYGSLVVARDGYYASQRFADVFAHLERAPEPLITRIAAIPGVATAETRLVETVMLPLDDLPEPATGRLIGIAAGHEPRLDAPLVRRGRMPEPGREDEVAVLESFADAHGLAPGAPLPAVLNGTARQLRIVGLVMSPEYVFAMPPGTMIADPGHFAILWMDRAVVGPAFALDGAFDDLALTLQPGASEAGVLERVDAILEPFGGLGATGREHQPSNYVVSNELAQLGSYALVGPLTSLSVAAFLVNVVLSRLVYLQRPQIATLKALGYTHWEIGLHYLELVVVITLAGAALGVGLGAWLGRGMLNLYREYFQFPVFAYHLGLRTVAASVAVSLLAGAGGGLVTVLRVARLPPAEAMLPEAPPTYRPSILERLGADRVLSAAGRMVMREMTRRPLRLLVSVLGIAMGVAVIVSGAFLGGAMDAIVWLGFERAQREDLAVTFTQPIDASALHDLAHVPGVLAVEGLRQVPVRLRHEDHWRDVVLTGHPPGAQLRRIFEWPGRHVEVPDQGVLLTDVLAARLAVGLGDRVDIEVREGSRLHRTVRVAGLTHEMLGLNADLAMPVLQALLDETDVVTQALLSIDPAKEGDVDSALKRMPRVAGVTRRKDIIAQFDRQSAESTRTTSLILTLFGALISVGVVYNSARITLSVRARDLASLRVLGFTRREISAVLLGELATYVVLALGPGLLLGRLLATWILSVNDPETYRMPAVVTPQTYVFAATVTVLAALASGLVVRRKLDHLDLVATLKARE